MKVFRFFNTVSERESAEISNKRYTMTYTKEGEKSMLMYGKYTDLPDAELNVTSSGAEKTSVTYDETMNEWFVLNANSQGLDITLEASLVPSTFKGITVKHRWIISSDIKDYFTISSDSTDRVILHIPYCPEDVTRGTIKYERTFIEGSVISETLNFALKAPKVAILSSVNSVLQQNMVDADIAQLAENYTYDTELWNVTNTIFGENVNVEDSELKHLAELDNFTSLTELDVSNCELLGSLSAKQLVEDGSYKYVDVLPTRDKTLTLDLTSVDLRNTQVKGINLKSNSSLEEIHYSDYTTEVSLINQDNLEELDLTMVDDDCDITIDGCDNLETLNI